MPPHQKIILVDQDNVIADQFGKFHEILRKEHPEIYSTYTGKSSSFQFEQDFAPEHAEAIFEVRRKVGFFRSLPLIPGAREALETIERSGHIVRIVTAPIRTPHSASEKLEWIAEYLGVEWCAKTIITRDKTLIRGDLLIDDNPNVTGSLRPLWEHILYDQPYNQYGAHRRLNWQNYKEILEI